MDENFNLEDPMLLVTRKYTKKRGRPKRAKKGTIERALEEREASADEVAKNHRKVQLETYRRSLDKVPGEGNFNDPRIFGGVDWSSVSFTHPSYEHIKNRHQYDPEMKLPRHKIIGVKRPRSLEQEVSKDVEQDAVSSSSSSSSSNSSSDLQNAPPLLVQLTPMVYETDRAREQLGIEYLANGGLGDLKHTHLMIRRYIAQNSPQAIMSHSDEVARKAVKKVMRLFPPTTMNLNARVLYDPHEVLSDYGNVEEEEEEEEDKAKKEDALKVKEMMKTELDEAVNFAV